MASHNDPRRCVFCLCARTTALPPLFMLAPPHTSTTVPPPLYMLLHTPAALLPSTTGLPGVCAALVGEDERPAAAEGTPPVPPLRGDAPAADESADRLVRNTGSTGLANGASNSVKYDRISSQLFFDFCTSMAISARYRSAWSGQPRAIQGVTGSHGHTLACRTGC